MSFLPTRQLARMTLLVAFGLLLLAGLDARRALADYP
jgi:hypothetical protein